MNEDKENDSLQTECEAVITPDECEELLAANQLIEQVKPIFADFQT